MTHLYAGVGAKQFLQCFPLHQSLPIAGIPAHRQREHDGLHFRIDRVKTLTKWHHSIGV